MAWPNFRVSKRVAIAIAVGCLWTFLAMSIVEGQAWHLSDVIDHVFREHREGIAASLVLTLPSMLIALGTYRVLSRWFSPDQGGDRETLCRKCGYILRGISEPRCPECGERI